MEVVRLLFAVVFSLLLLPSFAQEEFKKEMLGTLSRDTFSKEAELKQWFDKEYASYHPQDSSVQKLKSFLTDKKIVVVLGTWCSDSQREFPRLIKVLQEAHFPMNNLEIYGLNKKKTLPEDIVSQYEIKYVPTIILFDKTGKEVGRIIEETKVSIEYDLLEL